MRVLVLAMVCVGSVASAASLEGTWRTEDQTRELVFTKKTHQLKTSYIDAAGTKFNEGVTTGTYVLGETAVAGLLPLDLAHEQTLFRALVDPNDFFIPQANKIKLCGYDDWKLREFKNVTGCERLLMAGAGQRLYQSVKIEGDVLQTTQLDSLKGSIPEKRLTELLEWWAFKKLPN